MGTHGIARADAVPHVARPRHRVTNPHGHSVQFYQADSFLLDELSHFIGAALHEGRVGLVIATRAHREELAHRLRSVGMDLARAGEQGRFVALDAAETLALFMRDGWPDRGAFIDALELVIDRAVGKASEVMPRIAAFGEMVALLCAEGNVEAAIRLEELWNELAQKHAFELRCAYPLALFRQVEDPDHLGRIFAEHSRVILSESDRGLLDADESRQSISLLQQTALALKTEVEEHKKVEAMLRRRATELERTNRETARRADAAMQARDRFLSVASHELRTPVTALKGSTQLLRRRQARGELDDERLRRTLVVLDESASRLAQLASDLLDLSRMQTGQLALASEALDFRAVVKRSVERMNDLMEDNAPFVAHLPAGPAAIWGDADRLQQVLTNLLENSKKYSSSNDAVTVRLEPGADDGWLLSVRDQGIGLSPGAAELIFEPFSRLANPSAQHLPGLGLGLSISRNIVERHGGHIWAESAGEDAGTTFLVWLPASQAQSETQPAR